MEFAKEAEERAVALRSQVDSLMVVDQASYDLADKVNTKARDRKKAFHAWFDPIDDASKKQRQATIAQGKIVDDPLDYVIKVTGSKQGAWREAELARVAEEKRKAEAIARKAAEDAAMQAAEALQDAGMSAAAEAVLEAPIVVPKIEIATPAPTNGEYYRKSYSAEVVNLAELVKAVAEGKVPLYYLEANQTALNSAMRESKGQAIIPGVKSVGSTSQGRR